MQPSAATPAAIATLQALTTTRGPNRSNAVPMTFVSKAPAM